MLPIDLVVVVGRLIVMKLSSIFFFELALAENINLCQLMLSWHYCFIVLSSFVID